MKTLQLKCYAYCCCLELLFVQWIKNIKDEKGSF